MSEAKINIEEIWSMSLTPRSKEDIDLFYTGEKTVDDFIKNEAIKYHQVYSARTHLFYYREEMIGYFTLFADQVVIVASAKKKLNTAAFAVHKQKSYPAIRLHYLGVNSSFQKEGIGRYLLLWALDVCREIAESIGVNFVCIEALPTSKKFFEKNNFVKVGTDKITRGKDLINMVIRIEDIQSR